MNSTRFLPPPSFKSYPSTGFKRQLEPLDAQAMYDTMMKLKTAILDGILRPSLGLLRYILTWQERLLSGIVCVIAALACLTLSALLLVSGLFGIVGFLLVLLKNPERRLRISADPHIAPLSDDGYAMIATLRNTDAMVVYLKRVVAIMHGHVLDEFGMREFAAFAFDKGKPVTTYVDLKRQLREAGDILDDDEKFVSFPSTPLKNGTMVSYDNRVGEIVNCIDSNKRTRPPWSYEVAFGEDKIPEKRILKGDVLEAKFSLRWLSSPGVLLVIPDGFEDYIMSYQPSLEMWATEFDTFAANAHKFVSWEDAAKTFRITQVCFGLSISLACCAIFHDSLFVAVVTNSIKTIALLGVMFILTCRTIWYGKLLTRLRATKLQKKHAAKNFRQWPFFHDGFTQHDMSEDDTHIQVDDGRNCTDGDWSTFVCCSPTSTSIVHQNVVVVQGSRHNQGRNNGPELEDDLQRTLDLVDQSDARPRKSPPGWNPLLACCGQVAVEPSMQPRLTPRALPASPGDYTVPNRGPSGQLGP